VETWEKKLRKQLLSLIWFSYDSGTLDGDLSEGPPGKAQRIQQGQKKTGRQRLNTVVGESITEYSMTFTYGHFHADVKKSRRVSGERTFL